ncbi:Pnap_2097 family protein [Cupriavidus pinatubonensis]|uniref:Biosynthetic protein, Pnap_2097 family n=1 Tax=Cupriavidus pinatubonensis TaxID=248026 RepID=A0ABN7XS31_9BURK|nr:Pnap_2097 family protein [Cupriavidus pinatubonensis]CAG9163564.1 hypothetical protein LMG23994_00162 [Cupriavidus pinatubonensis]
MSAGEAHYVAGMPQLAYTGLSENWLLKTCGDLHWRRLAAGAGLATPDFRDAAGNTVYAAFTAVRVREAALETLGEHAAFSIGSALRPVGGARHFGEHQLRGANGQGARVSMLSTFIRRTRERDNRSVVRGVPVLAETGSDASATQEAADLAALARRFRNGDWDTHFGLDRRRDHAVHVVEYLPCPYTDFNGADLLYFASFQAMVDRAEWQWHRFADPPTVARRDLFYHGNVNVGEALELCFGAVRDDARGFAHWCEIRRVADGEKIADVVTEKQWRRR